eukprot:gene8910-858_t
MEIPEEMSQILFIKKLTLNMSNVYLFSVFIAYSLSQIKFIIKKAEIKNFFSFEYDSQKIIDIVVKFFKDHYMEISIKKTKIITNSYVPKDPLKLDDEEIKIKNASEIFRLVGYFMNLNLKFDNKKRMNQAILSLQNLNEFNGFNARNLKLAINALMQSRLYGIPFIKFSNKEELLRDFREPTIIIHKRLTANRILNYMNSNSSFGKLFELKDKSIQYIIKYLEPKFRIKEKNEINTRQRNIFLKENTIRNQYKNFDTTYDLKKKFKKKKKFLKKSTNDEVIYVATDGSKKNDLNQGTFSIIFVTARRESLNEIKLKIENEECFIWKAKLKRENIFELEGTALYYAAKLLPYLLEHDQYPDDYEIFTDSQSNIQINTGSCLKNNDQTLQNFYIMNLKRIILKILNMLCHIKTWIKIFHKGKK